MSTDYSTWQHDSLARLAQELAAQNQQLRAELACAMDSIGKLTTIISMQAQWRGATLGAARQLAKKLEGAP